MSIRPFYRVNFEKHLVSENEQKSDICLLLKARLFLLFLLKTAEKKYVTSFCVRAAPKSWSKYTTTVHIGDLNKTYNIGKHRFIDMGGVALVGIGI